MNAASNSTANNLQPGTSGPGYLWLGFKQMWAPGLKRYVLIPLSINILLFSLGIAALSQWFSTLMDRLLGFLPEWLAWLEYLLWPLFVVAVLLTVFYAFTLFANLLAAPFNGFLAARVEQLQTGIEPQTGRSMAAEITAAIVSELKKLTYTLLRFAAVGLIVLVLLFTPLSFITPVIWLLIGGWLLGLEYLEYPLANHGMDFKAVRQYAKARRKTTLSFGMAVSLITAIPLLNLFVMPAAVVGATRLSLDHPVDKNPT